MELQLLTHSRSNSQQGQRDRAFFLFLAEASLCWSMYSLHEPVRSTILWAKHKFGREFTH